MTTPTSKPSSTQSAPVVEPPPGTCSDVERGVSLLHPAPELFEIRVILRNGRILAGIFDEPAIAAKEIARIDAEHSPQGIYLSLNPLRDGSATNRIRKARKTVRNEDIACIQYVMIDLDPCRPTKTSSAEEQKQAALDRAKEINEWLTQAGFADPLVCMSGNGAYLIYRVDDLPIEQSSTIRELLQVLKERFDDGTVEVDGAVHNPARIIKVLGTTARKGDSTAETPHRRSWFYDPGMPLKVTPTAALEGVVANAAAEPETVHYRPANRRPDDDLERLRAAMRAIAGSEVDSYGDWTRIGLAAKQAGIKVGDPDGLLEAWIELSSRSDKFVSDADCRGKWRDLDPDGSLGAGTIVRMARQHGWNDCRQRSTTTKAMPSAIRTPRDPGVPWIPEMPTIPRLHLQVVESLPKNYLVSIPLVSDTPAELEDWPVPANRFEREFFRATNQPPPLGILSRDAWRVAVRKAMEEAQIIQPAPELCLYAHIASLLTTCIARCRDLESFDRRTDEGLGDGSSPSNPLPLPSMNLRGVLGDGQGTAYIAIDGVMDDISRREYTSNEATRPLVAKVLRAAGASPKRRYVERYHGERAGAAQRRLWVVPSKSVQTLHAIATGETSYAVVASASGGGER